MEKSKTRPGKESRPNGDSRSAREANLRKAVQNTIKTLHDLCGDLADADAVLDAARDTTVTVTNLRESVRKLEDEAARSKQAGQKMQESFVDNCARLVGEFQDRCGRLERECQTRLAEGQARAEAEVARLRSDLDAERQKSQSLTQKLVLLRAELEGRHEKERSTWTKEREAQQKHAAEVLHQAMDAEKKIATFCRDMEDQRTVIRGREKEKEILQRKLAVYEAFETFDVEGIRSGLESLRQGLSRFAEFCVGEAELLPEWNRVPEGLHRDGLPQHLNMATLEGQRTLTALVRHAVVTELASRVFVAAPSCSCNEMNTIGEMLHAHDPTLEAVWRQTAAAALLREPRISEGFQRKLKKMADHLVTSWKLPLRDKSRDAVQQHLLTFLCECQDQWLRWMRLKERLTVARTGPITAFTHDAEDDPVEGEAKAPADFTSASRPTPVLCVFPAVFRSAGPERTEDVLIFRGEAIYQDSPTLLKVVNDSQSMTSPRVSRN